MIFTFVSCGVVVGLAAATDFNGTVHMIGAIIGVRGVTWVVKNITQSINKDCSELINFAGWSIAGVNCLGIIKNSVSSIKSVVKFLNGIAESIKGVGESIDSFEKNIDDFVDKIIFWD